MMARIWSLLLLLLFTSICSCWQWPFQSIQVQAASDGSETVDADAGADQNDGTRRVAIIGAGAAGASTAHHLRKFAALSNLPIEITVFEKSSYVGGRSTTVNAYDDPNHPVELGASIFVDVNTILKNATEEFNLQSSTSETEDQGILGIWNGVEFVFIQKSNDGWWNYAKLFWKYGLAPIRTQRLMKSTVAKFRQLYDAPFFPFRSLSGRALDLDLIPITGITGEQLLEANGIGPPFSTDIIQASTRVNYGQNLGSIHGLETMVCMAIEGATSVAGGNWQIFSSMIKNSNSTLHLNTTVSSILKKHGKYRLSSSLNDSAGVTTSRTSAFDTVVLAAPFQYSNISLEDGLLKRVPDEIPYVRLHVTLFTSINKLNPAFFNITAGADMPDTILTTLPVGEVPLHPKDGAGPAGFWSISTLRSVINPKTIQKEYLYKIFSPREITPEFLSKLLDAPMPDDLTTITMESGDPISWYYPYVWNSYPYEYPRVTFEDPELARGFYYTSGMESFISTMETNALMGMNVAQLVLDDYLQVLEDKEPVFAKEEL